jgi:hypothetical protein
VVVGAYLLSVASSVGAQTVGYLVPVLAAISDAVSVCLFPQRAGVQQLRRRRLLLLQVQVQVQVQV